MRYPALPFKRLALASALLTTCIPAAQADTAVETEAISVFGQG